MKKIMKLWYVLVLASLMLTSCGTSGGDASVNIVDKYAGAAEGYSSDDMKGVVIDEITVEQPMDMDIVKTEVTAGEAPAAAQSLGDEAAAVNDLSARKLIRRADLTVETEEFDALIATVEEQVAALGGYMERFNTSNQSRYYEGSQSSRYAMMTIRIPEDNYDQFVSNVAEVSNVLNRNETVQDVTLQYVDMESHKKVLQTEQERLIILLEQADNIEDIIVIENRLSEVRYQIESMESQLRTFDNLIDYSTITLNITEVWQLTPVQDQTTWEKISTGFANSWSNLGLFFKNLMIFLIVAFPYLFVIAVFVAVILLIVKLSIRKSERRKSQNISRPSHQNNGSGHQNNGSGHQNDGGSDSF